VVVSWSIIQGYLAFQVREDSCEASILYLLVVVIGTNTVNHTMVDLYYEPIYLPNITSVAYEYRGD
jgi:hypothetical protein